MFGQLAQDYFNKNFIVVPITPGYKAPILQNWNAIDFSTKIDQYAKWGIGIKPKESGLLVLDIDIEIPEAKEEIKKLLPPIYCGRQGSPKRLPSIFFKYDPKFDGKSYGPIEILTNNKQCVIPPTIHPDYNIPYKWVGHTDLLNADMDLMPELDEQLFIDICKVVDKYIVNKSQNTIEITNSDGSRCNHGSHNKLSQVLIACMHEGKNIDETIKELLQRDSEINDKISYFECPSRKEWKSKNKELNAYQFVFDAYKRHNYTPTKEKRIELNFNQVEIKKKERIRFPHFRGVAQECFEYIYQNSDVPRTRMAIASTISLMGTLLSNKLNIGDKTYSNIYNLMILHSGGGKNFPLNFPKNFLAFNDSTRHLIGHSQPSSDTGIMKTLSTQNARVDTVDEATKLFMAHKSSGNNIHMAKIIDIYTELYSATGSRFAGKSLASSDKLIGECDSPCISLIAATTPEGFAQAFDKDLITKGLGARFMYWYDDKEKYSEFQLGNAARKPLPRNLINFANYWMKFKSNSNVISLTKFNQSHTLTITDSALEALKSVHGEFNKLQSHHGQDAVMRSIYARAFEQMQKILIIDVAASQFQSGSLIPPSVKVDNVLWCERFMLNYIKMMQSFIKNSLPDQFDNKYMLRFANIIKECQDIGISKSELGRKTGFYADKGLRKKIIESLVDSQNIFEIKNDGATFYIHSDFIQN